jgi:diguanylate cyclase (GGDEF)-like protein/PAS domain S-box-containing protein
LRQSELRFRSLSACSPVGIFMSDVDGRCTYTNPRCQAIVGCTSEEALGEGWTRFILPDDRERILEEWSAAVRAGSGFESMFRFLTTREVVRWVSSRSSPMHDDRGQLISYVGTLEEITAYKQAEERLAHQATHDALTGLPNRILLQRRVEQAIVSAQARGASLALLLLDLDRFKEINDTFGHHHGDVLLQQLSPRQLSAVRESDTVARLGGDEFGILLPGADRARAILVAERILDGLKQSILVERQALDIGISIGVAFYPDHGLDTTTLMQRADVAMYAAKRAGGGQSISTDGSCRWTR